MLTILFSSFRALYIIGFTFIVLVDIFDNNFALLFLNCCLCNFHSAGFEELLNFFFFVGVGANSAGGEFLELVPVIDDFIAAGPSFLKVMENGLSWMKMA